MILALHVPTLVSLAAGLHARTKQGKDSRSVCNLFASGGQNSVSEGPGEIRTAGRSSRSSLAWVCIPGVPQHPDLVGSTSPWLVSRCVCFFFEIAHLTIAPTGRLRGKLCTSKLACDQRNEGRRWGREDQRTHRPDRLQAPQPDA